MVPLEAATNNPTGSHNDVTIEKHTLVLPPGMYSLFAVASTLYSNGFCIYWVREGTNLAHPNSIADISAAGNVAFSYQHNNVCNGNSSSMILGHTFSVAAGTTERFQLQCICEAPYNTFGYYHTYFPNRADFKRAYVTLLQLRAE